MRTPEEEAALEKQEKFETAFVEFWESKECDSLNWVIYDLLKAAFSAGYRAAGKEPPPFRRRIHVSWSVEEYDNKTQTGI